MIELGKKQKLIIVRQVEVGAYVGETANAGEQDRVLLPKKQVPQGAKDGDKVEVFIYKDSSDRLIATTNEPLIKLGEVAVLEVAETGQIGTFLNWGLEKDLLLPFREQTKKVKIGDSCLVALYIDKSKRLCATMKVYHYLKTNSPYIVGDNVIGSVYEISDNFGAFVAVDNQYSGLVPKQEAQGHYHLGEAMEFRVTAVKEDGKLNLSNRKKVQEQMNEDSDMLVKELRELNGVLPFDDKANPEVIKEKFGISKSAFKRAVGRLLKEGKIELKNSKIYLK